MSKVITDTLETVDGTKSAKVSELNRVRTYQVTDSTDIVLSAHPTQSSVGTSISATIPTKGQIELVFDQLQLNVSSAGHPIFGIRIGATNYFPSTDVGGTLYYPVVSYLGGVQKIRGQSAACFFTLAGSQNANAESGLRMSIEGLSIPTGVQTVQVVAAKLTPGTCTIQGTTLQTKVGVYIFDHS